MHDRAWQSVRAHDIAPAHGSGRFDPPLAAPRIFHFANRALSASAYILRKNWRAAALRNPFARGEVMMREYGCTADNDCRWAVALLETS
jgi:hypothetical protein